MATAVVIRPGETDFDEQHRIQGDLDLPLTERGQMQLQEMIERLRSQPLEIVYASPTEPAWTCAAELAAALDVPIRKIEGLRNLDQGLWEGMRVEDVRRKHPRVYKQWQEAPESICAPEGETCGEAFRRVAQVLRKPVKRKGNFAVVVSEPLATLVSSVLRTGEAELPGPRSGRDVEHQVEFIEVIPSKNGRRQPASETSNGRHPAS